MTSEQSAGLAGGDGGHQGHAVPTSPYLGTRVLIHRIQAIPHHRPSSHVGNFFMIQSSDYLVWEEASMCIYIELVQPNSESGSKAFCFRIKPA